MRQLPPRRMNPLGLAVGAVAVQAAIDAKAAAPAPPAVSDEDFERQLREKTIQLELKPKMRELARQMQENLEAELRKVIERFLGEPITDPERQVKGRLVHVQPPAEEGGAEADRGTVYAMDGVAILRAGPQVLERRGDEIHAFQLVEQLLPEDFKPAGKGGIILPSEGSC